MPMYRGLPSAVPGNLRTARDIADRVICLPIYPILKEGQTNEITALIAEAT